jgi:putative nucleotidyltransferase with HDIG domain
MNVIDNFFDKINNLPMLPKVVQEVMQLLGNSEVDIKALANKINHDQVLAARVLRMSNSAYFGCSRTIKTIEDAVGLIGLQNLKSLVIASGVTATFTEVPGMDLKRFWQHSLVTASIARQLARELRLDAETAYIGGLMHSVGQLPMHLVFPAASAQVEEACRGRSVLERMSIEQSIMGLDHCQVGEVLAKLWNFPEEILHLIRYYAEPFSEHASKISRVIYAAVHIASDLEADKAPSYIAETMDFEVAKALSLDDTDDFIERIESYRGFVSEAQNYL